MAKILASKDASDALRQRADWHLVKNGIYKVASHGWIGPNDVDPKEIGHAMAQLDDPADEVLSREWYSKEPVVIAEWKALTSIAGADFEGLMNDARLQIGFALVQIFDLQESLDEDSLAAMYSRAAYMTLGAASDRIRDYLVYGVFRTGPLRGKYVTPFENVAKLSIQAPSVRARF